MSNKKAEKWYSIQYEISSFPKTDIDDIERELIVLEKVFTKVFWFNLDNEYIELHSTSLKLLSTFDRYLERKKLN